MQDYGVSLSGVAKDDIRGIYVFFDDVLCEHKRAVHVYRSLKEAVRSLRTMPKRRPLLEDTRFAAQGVRSLSVEGCLVFYLVHDVPASVVALRVLHERREWSALLEPPAPGEGGS